MSLVANVVTFSAVASTVNGNTYAVNGSTSSFGLYFSPISKSAISVNINGVVQLQDNYVFPSTTLGNLGLDLTSTPISGEELEITIFYDDTVVYEPTNALVSLSEVKNFLTINSTTYDGKLANVILYASGLIESYCSRSFKAANVEFEYQDGGKPYVFADRIPVNTIYSISEYDGSQYVPLSNTPSDGGLPNVAANANSAASYTWDSGSGKIWKGISVITSSSINGQLQAFTPYSKGIRLSYNGGYTDVPQDIKLCALYLIKDIHKGMDEKITSIGREQLEKMPYTGGFPPHIRRVLDLYRLVV